MTVSILWGVVIATTGISVLLWLIIRFSYRNGKSDERHAEDEKRKKAVDMASHVRDRLVYDTAFARRVRARFRR